MSATGGASRTGGFLPALLAALAAAALALSPLALHHAWLGTHAHLAGHPGDQPPQEHDANPAFCLKCVLLSAQAVAPAGGIPAWRSAIALSFALVLLLPLSRSSYRKGARAPPEVSTVS